MNSLLKRKTSAYLTVEASLIVPLITFLLIVIIYWVFYVYNNCVVYQDCYIASLRGSQLLDMDSAQVDDNVKTYINELLGNQLFQFQKEYEVRIGLISIEVSADSEIENKLKGHINTDVAHFKIYRKAESKITDPVKIIRSIY